MPLVLYTRLVVLDPLDFMYAYPRGILMIFAIIHLMAFLNCLTTMTRAFTCLSFRSTETMIGKVLLAPKNAYLMCVGRLFNSNTGGSSMDVLVGGDSRFCKNLALTQLGAQGHRTPRSIHYLLIIWDVVTIKIHQHSFHGVDTLSYLKWCFWFSIISILKDLDHSQAIFLLYLLTKVKHTLKCIQCLRRVSPR